MERKPGRAGDPGGAPGRRAGDRPGTQRLAEEALAHYRPLPEETFADLFVVLAVARPLLVRSTRIHMPDRWDQFKEDVREWTQVELAWWCDDQQMRAAERAALVRSIAPALHRIDVANGRLSAVDDGAAYRQARCSPARLARQFAYLDAAGPPEAVAHALRARFAEVHGLALNVDRGGEREDTR